MLKLKKNIKSIVRIYYVTRVEVRDERTNVSIVLVIIIILCTEI